MDEQLTINSVIQAAEAEKLWGLRPSTVEKACLSGRFTKDEYRKSEDDGVEKGTWLVTIKGMIRVYGDIILRFGENADRIQKILQNPNIDDRYISVYRHRGVDICTLKQANPSNGDKLGYVIDYNYYKFKPIYDTVQSAIDDIDANWHVWDLGIK